MQFLKAFLITLLFIVILNCGIAKAQAVSKAPSYQNYLENLLTVLMGGGAGAGSSYAIAQSITKQKSSHSDLTGNYKDSPDYLKDKIVQLEKENEKLKNAVSSLKRRFQYIDSKLSRLNSDYTPYDERIPPKSTQ